jgi:hypothetical protein
LAKNTKISKTPIVAKYSQSVSATHAKTLHVYTTTHGESLLGVEEVVTLVKHIPTLDISPESRSARNYMALLNTAVLAGRITAQWANIKPSK